MATTIIWKDVVGYEGFYRVSNTGLVESVSRIDTGGVPRGGFQMKQALNCRNGYFDIALSKDGVRKRLKIHTLVCTAFHGPKPSNEHECRHLDGNQHNNLASNLAWGTRKENANDRTLHGTGAKGEKNGGGQKLRDDDVRAIKARLALGEKQRDIAPDFGVSYGLIGHIANGRVWSHIT